MTESTALPETRILIVEDDAIINRHLQSCLLKVGYRVVGTTSSGSEAIKLASQTSPDVVLMDISLHGEMDGIEAAEAIRSWHDIPVIFLTAFADEQSLQRAKATNPFGYILKPFDQRSLYTTIEMAMNKHQLEKRLRDNEEMLRTLVENQGEGVVIVDSDENLTYANPAAEAIFGTSIKGLIGHNLREFTSEKSYEYIRKQTSLRMQGLKSVYEMEILRSDGQERILSVTATPWFDKQGRFSGAFGILSDITERKMVEAAEREQRNLADALRETATLLGSTLDTNEVLERILQNVGRVVPHNAANVMILEGEKVQVIRGKIQPDSSTGQHTMDHPLLWKNYPFFLLMVQTGQPAIMPGDVSSQSLPRNPRMAWLKSIVGAPIKINNRIIGFINLGSSETHFYTRQHAERLMAFAGQAALALENARLFDETHQRALYLSLLNEITQTAIHSSNLNETMGLISQQMARLFNADGAYITLWDDQQQLSIPAAAYGVNQEGYKDIPAKPNERTLTLSVLELGQTLVVDDLQSTPYIEPQLARTYPFQTLIGLPLISDNQKLGAVILGFTLARSFSAEELERGEQAARQVALAIAKSRLYAEVQRLAITDALTNLLNRRGIFELAQKEVKIAQHLKLPLSLLWLDLDHFKFINDQYGHHIGDEVVKEIAARIRSVLRDRDLVGRYGGEGGDEFIIVLPETDHERALQVAERLRVTVSQTPVASSVGAIAVTASVGFTSLLDETEALEALLHRADEQMYAAKSAGRNRVCSHQISGG